MSRLGNAIKLYDKRTLEWAKKLKALDVELSNKNKHRLKQAIIKTACMHLDGLEHMSFLMALTYTEMPVINDRTLSLFCNLKKQESFWGCSIVVPLLLGKPRVLTRDIRALLE